MSAKNSIYSMESNTVVRTNGTTQTTAELRAEIRAKRNKKTKRTPRTTSVTIVGEYISLIEKNLGVLKNIRAYRNNAKRQWGQVAEMLLNLNGIRKPMTLLVADIIRAEELITTIKGLSKRNQSDTFQYLQKLSWKFMDINDNLQSLIAGVDGTGVLTQFATHECVNGKDKRLGLRVITNRARKATDKIVQYCAELDGILNQGRDPLEYDTYRTHISVA